METFVKFIVYLFQLIAPQPCFDEIFVKHNFLDVSCLKIILSKCVGYAIICAATIVKVPQILKILQASSAAGLSFTSCTMELVGITGSLVYGFAMGFPFSSYGESVFMMLQTLIIAILVLLHTHGSRASAAYAAVWIGVLSYLLSPAAPMFLVWSMQISVMPLIASSRLVQVLANYRNGSTGQLSAITTTLLFGGALARIFTSIQETGDITVIATYVVSFVVNGMLLGQVIYYWNSPTPATTAASNKSK